VTRLLATFFIIVDEIRRQQLPRKNFVLYTVPQTDTGEQVEYTKALERTMLKELGKMTP
jgi:hypothetical protein